MERVLITGGNRGLGFESAKQLLQNGYEVIITSRGEEAGASAINELKEHGDAISFLQLEVTDEAQQTQLVNTLQEQFGCVDVLLNNAGGYFELEGAWIGNTSINLEQEVLRKTFDVNFFSVVSLTQKMIPLLKKSEHGRIVNVSSIMGSLGIHSDPEAGLADVKPLAYDASKTALNAFTIHLSAALKEFNIPVNSVHPGWVQTDMGTEMAPLTLPEGAKTLVDMVMDKSGKTGQFIHLGQPLPW